MNNKIEYDYVVEANHNNAMVLKKLYTDRAQMLTENPNVNRDNFIVIEDENRYVRYNEINGKKMIWVTDEQYKIYNPSLITNS